MNEMLGNQYFITRQYPEAVIQLEKVLILSPNNNTVKKKLIICYIRINEIEKALRLFEDLIFENIDIIINNNDPVVDCCPCREMIYEMEGCILNYTEIEKSTILGILYLYCDIYNSEKYFNKLSEIEPDKGIYKKIVRKINQSSSKTFKE